MCGKESGRPCFVQGTLGILDNHVSFASIRSLVGRGISHLVASVYNGPAFV